MPLLGERSKRLRQEGQAFDPDRELAAPRRHDAALRPHDVTEVELVEELVALAELVRRQEELQIRSRVANGGERQFAVPSKQDDPPGHTEPFVGHLIRLQGCEPILDVAQRRGRFEPQGERFDAADAKPVQLLAARRQRFGQASVDLVVGRAGRLLSHPAARFSRRSAGGPPG
jgi:hypothetical protein